MPPPQARSAPPSISRHPPAGHRPPSSRPSPPRAVRRRSSTRAVRGSRRRCVRQKPDFVGPDGANDTFLGFTLASAGLTGGKFNTSIAACQNNPSLSEFLRHLGGDAARRGHRGADPAGGLGGDSRADLLGAAKDAPSPWARPRRTTSRATGSSRRVPRSRSSRRVRRLLSLAAELDHARQLDHAQLVGHQRDGLHGLGRLERRARE